MLAERKCCENIKDGRPLTRRCLQFLTEKSNEKFYQALGNYQLTLEKLDSNNLQETYVIECWHNHPHPPNPTNFQRKKYPCPFALDEQMGRMQPSILS
jgi:hypothetical protein